MWRQRVRRLHGHFWRLVLGLLLLAVLVSLPVLALLGSEGGSRWLVERGLGMQGMVALQIERGTLLTGLDMRDVVVHGRKFDIRIRHLLARWSLLQLFRGELALSRFEADDVALRLTAPPSGEPTRLPVLILPFRLVAQSIELRHVELWSWQARQPKTLDRLALAGRWEGISVRVDQLLAERAGLGRLSLQGKLRLYRGYPLQATGSLELETFRQHGWQPLSVRLQDDVASLSLQVRSEGPLSASATIHVQPLLPATPYTASLQWQAVKLPWWTDQSFSSDGGSLRLVGDLSGLRSLGDARLEGRQLPAGRYVWRLRTDWKSVDIESLNFNGLGGKLDVDGKVAWEDGWAWKLTARLSRLDLSRKWPSLKLVLPVSSGKFDSIGRTKKTGSELTASLHLDGGESWTLAETGSSWPWNVDASQKVVLGWERVRRQLPRIETIDSSKGQLVLEGRRQDYRLALAAALDGQRLPAGNWVAEATGKDRHLLIQRLDYEGDAGHLGFGGELDLSAPLHWRGALVANDFTTAWLSPDWPGQFSGYVTGYGTWGEGVRQVHLDDMHVTGQLQGKQVAVDGGLQLVLPESGWPRGIASGLRADWGDNHLVLNGGLEKEWSLSAELRLGHLQDMDLPLQGGIQGRFRLQGDEQHPDVDADLAAQSLEIGDFRAATAHLLLQLPRMGEQPGSARLALDDATTLTGRELGSFTLDVAGTRQAHVVTWRTSGSTVEGDGQLSGSLDADARRWSGQEDKGRLSVADMDWVLEAPFGLDVSLSGHQLHMAAHCWSSGEARLCSQDDLLLGPRGHVRLALTGLKAERLGGLMPEGLEWSGPVSGEAKGGWEVGEQPFLQAGIHADGGQFRLSRDEEAPPLVFDYRQLALLLDAGQDNVRLQMELASDSMGQGHVDAAINPYGDDKSLQGELSLQGLRLDLFQPFFPALGTLAGSVSASGALTGTLHQPQFRGNVSLADGELAMRRLPLSMHKVSVRADINGTDAEVSGDARSGKGGIRLKGHADWSQQPHLDMDITGERFEVSQPPRLLAELDPLLHLQLVPGQMDITGTVGVPTGRLNLQTLSDQAVALSPDVHVLAANEGGTRVQVASAMQGWQVNADIEVRLGDDVYFHGFGVNGRLAGGLHLRQQGRRGLEATGEVELDKDSRYEAYGQRLQIRRGRLIFAGNLSQPGLDVEAVREIDSKVVGVRVEGRANAPQATVFSDTPMSQEEIISYLVLGRPLTTSGKPDAGGSNNNLALAAAAIKLGATGTQGMTSDIGNTLGITDFALDAEGNGDDTQFTVSGYLSPKLYLRYGVGVFTPVNTATVRYKINSSLYLEAVSSLENAIDLFYNLRF